MRLCAVKLIYPLPHYILQHLSPQKGFIISTWYHTSRSETYPQKKRIPKKAVTTVLSFPRILKKKQRRTVYALRSEQNEPPLVGIKYNQFILQSTFFWRLISSHYPNTHSAPTQPIVNMRLSPVLATVLLLALAPAASVDGAFVDYFSFSGSSASAPQRVPESTSTTASDHSGRDLATSPIKSFVLVNTKTKRDIMVMVDGMTVDTSDYGTELSIRVETTFTTGFVKIDFDHGLLKRVEGLVPYYLAGDENGVIYTANSLAVPGPHTMVACPSETAFFDPNDAQQGSGRRRKLQEDPTCLTISFDTVEDGIPPPTEPPVIVPTTDVVPPEAGIYGIVTGDLMQWHLLTLAFSGPPASETGMTIPGTYRPPSVFPDYLFEVTFTNSKGETFTVPGYYSGDGDAANNQGVSGNVWKVHLSPPSVGTWTWVAKFAEGTNVAQNGGGNPGGFFDGAAGSFDISPSNITDPLDFRSKGRLYPDPDSNFFKFANGEYFIKAGPDSPQNLFAYSDFDGTPNFGNYSKAYVPHQADYNLGEPTFAGGKGTGLIGAINYLSSKGVNIISVTTLNLDGDDKNIFPFVRVDNQLQYDISKLGQWRVIFEYAETKGIAIRVKLQDGASDNVLNKGELFEERKLYYREIMARFGHNLAIIWDLGEDITVARIAERSAFLRLLDAYGSPIVVRTTSSSTAISALLDIPTVNGVSLITPDMSAINSDTAAWLKAGAGGLAVSSDEQGSAATGVAPDFVDKSHDTVRKDVLWGNLMAGGTGVQYYFGTSLAESDLTLEDFRSRDALWDQSKYALDFFKNNKIPVQNMASANSLVSSGSLCLASKDSSTIVVYAKTAITSPTVTVSGSYTVSWYNPRVGGALSNGSVSSISNPGSLGNPPTGADAGDWVILLKKV
jgi:Domain of unknown function (DUF5060)